MATSLLTNASSGTSSLEAHTDACTIVVEGDSVMDGARVVIKIAATNSAGKLLPPGLKRVLYGPGAVTLDVVGDYFVRAEILDEGPATDINCLIL